ncbi:hypothetical protein AKJ63_00055 [candidate division MSBL1 archaeon SCGC-AAA259D18]|uniref:Methyltransferase small domain-containing protein n=1 Tax=candidate division MSBL1 archaeon SCGC-AAA259D18 TaxID=1698262 RepID=A0A133UCV9_9EURY|nr:hypothetical protein AKJ63_00055 [candidate division MSBL1 archaeon SCGC-AAA259D18]
MKLEVPEGVYKPAEDTFLLADNLEVKKGESVLEIGTGCGLLSILAAKEGARVTATDISPKAIKCAEENSEKLEVRAKIKFRKGDLFDPVERKNFDLIVFNPPYLPVPDAESPKAALERSWNGGKDGRKVIDRFLDQVEGHLNRGGRFSFIQSSLSDVGKTLKSLEGKKFRVNMRTEKLSFERLYLFQVTSAGQ